MLPRIACVPVVLLVACLSQGRTSEAIDVSTVTCDQAEAEALAKSSSDPPGSRRIPSVFCVRDCDWSSGISSSSGDLRTYRFDTVEYVFRDHESPPDSGDVVCAEFFGQSREDPSEPRIVGWVISIHDR